MNDIKVLLVDDEEAFVETLAERLEVRDFTVFTSFSGADAIGILEDKEVDVVVLDVLMPGQSGIDTLREIKSLNPLVEVIMLTGHATVETAIEGMKLGAFDYLMKPTETEDLTSKIKSAFARKAEQEDRIQKAHIEHIVKTRGW